MSFVCADDVIRKEIESVPARRVILDQLEGGPKSGSQLRESIRKRMAGQKVKRGGKKADVKKIKVSDPKLYFNTKHLEEIGIITSWKEGKQRIYKLQPRAIQPVRRILRIVERPTILLSSLISIDYARILVNWYCKETEFNFRALRLIVEKDEFEKGVSKSLDKYIPTGSAKDLTVHWHELESDVAGHFNREKSGNLMATYAYIERLVIDHLPEFNVVVDLSLGPPVIILALNMVATEYSLNAIYLKRDQSRQTGITHIIPGEGIL